MSFLLPPEQAEEELAEDPSEPGSDVADAGSDILTLTEREKLDLLMERWRTGRPPGM